MKSKRHFLCKFTRLFRRNVRSYLFCKSFLGHALILSFVSWWSLTLSYDSVHVHFLSLHNLLYLVVAPLRLPLCLTQVPVSLILNPVQIGQAEQASFDQALISAVLTLSAHPDSIEPQNPRGVLQTGLPIPDFYGGQRQRQRQNSSCFFDSQQQTDVCPFFKPLASPFDTINLWFHVCFSAGFFLHVLNSVGIQIGRQCETTCGWEQHRDVKVALVSVTVCVFVCVDTLHCIHSLTLYLPVWEEYDKWIHKAEWATYWVCFVKGKNLKRR